jgi:hypothetical protein
MPTDPLAWIDQELEQLATAGLRANIRTLDSPMDAWVTIDGRRLLNFCANNYLGLANHPRCARPSKRAIDQYGVGPGAVRTIAGTMSLHVELENGWRRSSTPRPASPSRAALRPIWRHSRPGGPRRPDLLRRVEPRQHHRRLPAEPGRNGALCPQRRGRPAPAD